eukprot:2094286-Alexandrium_andersonii.AAC.1
MLRPFCGPRSSSSEHPPHVCMFQMPRAPQVLRAPGASRTGAVPQAALGVFAIIGSTLAP